MSEAVIVLTPGRLAGCLHHVKNLHTIPTVRIYVAAMQQHVAAAAVVWMGVEHAAESGRPGPPFSQLSLARRLLVYR